MHSTPLAAKNLVHKLRQRIQIIKYLLYINDNQQSPAKAGDSNDGTSARRKEIEWLQPLVGANIEEHNDNQQPPALTIWCLGDSFAHRKEIKWLQLLAGAVIEEQEGSLQPVATSIDC